MSNRIPVIAGNWKMNKTVGESLDFIKAIVPLVKDVEGKCEVVLGAPFTSLGAMGEALKGTNVELSAQDVYWEKSGAYTGEVAPGMLKDVGCQWSIIGHSERRAYFGETDETINKKAFALYEEGLKPIICVGELLEEREAGKTNDVVSTQIRGCLKDIPADKMKQTVIAYEPVWAIGTGKAATPEMAQEVHAMIRALLAELYGEELASSIRILYGGSVKPSNVSELMGQEDIDGALVGGASLEADSFNALVHH